MRSYTVARSANDNERQNGSSSKIKALLIAFKVFWTTGKRCLFNSKLQAAVKINI